MNSATYATFLIIYMKFWLFWVQQGKGNCEGYSVWKIEAVWLGFKHIVNGIRLLLLNIKKSIEKCVIINHIYH